MSVIDSVEENTEDSFNFDIYAYRPRNLLKCSIGQKNSTKEKYKAIGRNKNWRTHTSSKGANFKNFKPKMCRSEKADLVLLQRGSRA